MTYTSPTCNGSVTGVGHSVAERVWYRTLTTKLTSSGGYAAARNGGRGSRDRDGEGCSGEVTLRHGTPLV